MRLAATGAFARGVGALRVAVLVGRSGNIGIAIGRLGDPHVLVRVREVGMRDRRRLHGNDRRGDRGGIGDLHDLRVRLCDRFTVGRRLRVARRARLPRRTRRLRVRWSGRQGLEASWIPSEDRVEKAGDMERHAT